MLDPAHASDLPPQPPARLVGPAERLRRAVARLGVEPSLVRQLQAPELAPGIVEVPGQLLVRLDVPAADEEGKVRWERVDVVMLAGRVVTTEPRRIPGLSRVLDGPPAPPPELLARVLELVPAELARVQDGVERELAMLEAGSVPAPIATPRLRADLGVLSRGVELMLECSADASARATAFASPDELARLTAVHDRLRASSLALGQLRERLDTAGAPAAALQAQVAAESTEVVEVAASLGQQRLKRLTLAHAVTAFIGGMAVSFGAMAASWTAGPVIGSLGFERAQLLGSLAFPIGFVILIIGKGELFTENFFVPVTGVLAGRGRVRDLLSLWGSTLAFNLVGVALFAFLASRPGVLGDHAADYMRALAATKVAPPFWASFMKAIFAGWLMTVLTWLLLAARGMGPRLFVIYLVGFLISAGEFNHVVISSAEVFLGMLLGAPLTLGAWFTRAFLPGLTGNLVGGVVFVTLLGLVQARSLRRSEEALRGAAELH